MFKLEYINLYKLAIEYDPIETNAMSVIQIVFMFHGTYYPYKHLNPAWLIIFHFYVFFKRWEVIKVMKCFIKLSKKIISKPISSFIKMKEWPAILGHSVVEYLKAFRVTTYIVKIHVTLLVGSTKKAARK